MVSIWLLKMYSFKHINMAFSQEDFNILKVLVDSSPTPTLETRSDGSQFVAFRGASEKQAAI